MSRTTLQRLAVALALLLLAWLGLAQIRGSSKDASAKFALPRFNTAAVDRITLARATDTVRFSKQGSSWTVNGHVAAPSMVSELLEAAADTTARGDLVAESPSSHARLGIDSATARRIVMLAGDTPLFALLVGKQGDDSSSGSVRLPGQNRVYQLKGKLAELADRGLDDWRDKQILALAPDSIERIEVSRGKLSYALVRSYLGWMVGTAAADSAAVQGLLNQLRRLDASGFVTAAQADSARRAKPNRKVRFLAKGGRLLAALEFDSTAAGYWVRRDGDPTVFRLDQGTVAQLTPAESALRKH